MEKKKKLAELLVSKTHKHNSEGSYDGSENYTSRIVHLNLKGANDYSGNWSYKPLR